VVFRGSGYYVTDSRGKSSTLATNGKSENGNGKSETKVEAKGEGKSETKTESKSTPTSKSE
jgi:predicted nucleic acid-binding Zn ribbon protein